MPQRRQVAFVEAGLQFTLSLEGSGSSLVATKQGKCHSERSEKPWLPIQRTEVDENAESESMTATREAS